MKILTQADIPGLFGTVKPIGPFTNTNPMQDLSNFISFGLRMVVLLAGGLMLIFMLWGAIDWITSGGEKEKLTKAQNKITNAVIGIFALIVVFVIFGLLTGDILKIIKFEKGQFIFSLPTL